MSIFRLITAIVPHDRCDLISDAAQKAGSWGGTVLSARGISASNFLDILGLGETSREIVMILTEAEKCSDIISAIASSTENEKKNFGIVYTTNAGQLLKAGKTTGEQSVMNGKSTQHLITVILNRGFADDAMSAARKAGAGGGTVLNAKGTAKEDDAKFFGVHIVPEKEMLQIVVPNDRKDAVLEAIRTLPCLSQPGSGICFCSEIEDFTVLGKK